MCIRDRINDGRLRHSEHELLSGLRRGISLGSLKMYIDAKMDMSLEEVLEFLKPHLKGRTPSELLSKLSGLTQKSDQSASNFLLEALQLRQLLIAGSTEDGVTYDTRMAHAIFLNSIRTGLRNESVRTRMLPYLDPAKNISDSVLITELNRAVGEEEERRRKQGNVDGKKRTLDVGSVDMERDAVQSMLSQLQATTKQLQENQSAMLAMQEQVNELVNLKSKLEEGYRGFVPKKCKNCQPENKYCTHCWKCCKGGHKAQDCNEPPGF